MFETNCKNDGVCIFSEGEKKKVTAPFFLFSNELQPALEIGGFGLANPIQNEMQI